MRNPIAVLVLVAAVGCGGPEDVEAPACFAEATTYESERGWLTVYRDAEGATVAECLSRGGTDLRCWRGTGGDHPINPELIEPCSD